MRQELHPPPNSRKYLPRPTHRRLNGISVNASFEWIFDCVVYDWIYFLPAKHFFFATLCFVCLCDFYFFGSEHKFAWPNSSGICFRFLRSQIRAKCFWSSKVNSCLQLTNISKESFPLQIGDNANGIGSFSVWGVEIFLNTFHIQ